MLSMRLDLGVESAKEVCATCTNGVYTKAENADVLVAVFEGIRRSIVKSTFPYNIDIAKETTNNVVVDESSVTPAASSIEVLNSGETKITWANIDTGKGLAPDQTFTFGYQAYASGGGNDIEPTGPEASVAFTDRSGENTASLRIPQRTIDVNQQPDIAVC